ncbi:winged helix-turn-helix domain-containing protein [Candidatus Woesearchaeota archaeon]|nr:winged helix-turn-helix domain-containing protein [Candidatus Woesearchaeota archaeon]MBW3013914.1 winged helix-turn-helix domain-containing protein [Candidatus Woesearchaeota archaeon]
MTQRRTRMDIISDMLASIRNKGGKIKPTHLMYKANLSHKLLNTYLDDLVAKELVKEIEGKYKYLVITEKGYEFLEQFDKMRKFQETFGL